MGDIFRKSLIALQTWLSHNPPPGVKIYKPLQTNYVKIDIWNGLGPAKQCHGSLVADNVVLTAGHCLRGKWDDIMTHYGRDFAHTVAVVRNDAQPNWARIYDKEKNMSPDLALFRLPAPVRLQEGAIAASIPAQDACKASQGPAQAYRGIGLLSDQMGIQPTKVSGIAFDETWGTTLRTRDKVAVKGDSGSPLMSSDGTQIGVHAGSTFYAATLAHVESHSVALCAYADAIKAQVREWNASPAPARMA
jgi:V8-like Glu-specific endopeptidase